MKNWFNTKSFSLSIHTICRISLVYLALSVIIFFWGWFEPYISIFITLGICWSIYICSKKTPVSNIQDENALELTRGDWLQICIIFFIIVFSLLYSGLAGVFNTHGDYRGFRNGMYHNLIDAPWPLILPDGKEMTYYLSGLLVPAALSRITSSYYAQQWILLLWSVVPIFLALIALFCKLRKISWIFALSALFINFDLLCKVPPIDIIIDTSKNVCRNLLGEFDKAPLSGRWIAWGMNLAALLAVSTPALVCALFVCINKNMHIIIPLAMAMLAVISPIGAISIFPLALFFYIRSIKHSKLKLVQIGVALIVPTAIALFLAVYHLRSDSEIYVGFTHIAWGLSATVIYYIPAQILLTIIFIFLYKNNENKLPIIILFLTITLCPILYIGAPPSDQFAGYNELWFKGSPAYIMLTAYYVTTSWNKIPRIFKYFWIYWTAITIITLTSWAVLDPMVYRGGYKAEDILNGHLYHPEHTYLKRCCPETKEPLIKGIILRESGESEKQFPGCLLPKAPGCDYSRPLCK